MLNRRKFLYIGFVLYLFVVFIPVNLILYFPSVLPFSLPNVEQEIVIDTLDNTALSQDLSQESSMSEEMTENNASNNSAFGTLLDKDISDVSSVTVKPNYGIFKGCSNDVCDLFNVYTSTLSEEKTIKVESHTSFLCVNRRINGTDMSTYNINFDIEDDLFSPIDYSKVATVLATYTEESPLQYESVGSNISWVSLYLEDCNDIK